MLGSSGEQRGNMHSLPCLPTPLPPLLLPTEIAGFENPPDVQNTVMCWGKAVGYSNHELEGVSEGLKTQRLWLRLSSPLILFSFIISTSEIFPGGISGSSCSLSMSH